MNLKKLLFASALTLSHTFATHTFTAYTDICETTETQECLNPQEQLKNIQIALNNDKNLKVNLETDGKWGENTKDAIIKFQEHYKLTPALGYVGTKTKQTLDKVIAKNVKLVKVDFDKTITKKTDSISSNCYANFTKKNNLRSSFSIFEDKKLLSRANGRNTKIKVDISEQRIRLYVDGKVALCSPCTTGSKSKVEPNTKTVRDMRTPQGTFKIQEKIADKRSSIFGKFYRNGKLVYKGDRRKFKGNGKYEGASLQNWMRLTGSGIGMHASKFIKRSPGSNGCIRIPYKVSKVIFSKVSTGTPVTIGN